MGGDSISREAAKIVMEIDDEREGHWLGFALLFLFKQEDPMTGMGSLLCEYSEHIKEMEFAKDDCLTTVKTMAAGICIGTEWDLHRLFVEECCVRKLKLGLAWFGLAATTWIYFSVLSAGAQDDSASQVPVGDLLPVLRTNNIAQQA